MLNKLLKCIRQYDMVTPGDRVICAVSGGADSMALLFAMYLLREKLGITVAAAHYNHCLRGQESDRDEAFVRGFCDRYDIELFVGSGAVTAGEKGLEAAAREARYGFLKTLPGKIATAHTADDNAETVLMHLVRGTGLKGLGGITPVRDPLIRPMLYVTREEVLAFLQDYHISYVVDSSNETDAFLRNRLRHHVMPILRRENPRLAENVSAMALRLREDEAVLSETVEKTDSVTELRNMKPSQRSRVLSQLLQEWGVREPEAQHIAMAEGLVFSRKPSAAADFPGGITLRRNYDRLEVSEEEACLAPVTLACPGVTEAYGLRVTCDVADNSGKLPDSFTVAPQGTVFLRSRQPGDSMRLQGGTKTLKKLFIDRKIPASRRMQIPVIADELGVLWVCEFGPNRDRLCESGIRICIEEKEK